MAEPRPPAGLESTLDGFTWETELRVDPIVPWVGFGTGAVLGAVGTPIAALVGFVLAVINQWIGPINTGHVELDLTIPGLVFAVICGVFGEIGRRIARAVAYRRAQVVITLDTGEVAVRRDTTVLASAPVGQVFVGVGRSFLRVGTRAFTLHGVSPLELTWLERALREVTRDRGASDEVPAALRRLRAPER